MEGLGAELITPSSYPRQEEKKFQVVERKKFINTLACVKNTTKHGFTQWKKVQSKVWNWHVHALCHVPVM
jgi:hypothetical protein